MSDEAAAFRCPACGGESVVDRSRGDLVGCRSCGASYWALGGGGEGTPFRTPAPRKGTLWSAWVAAVSAVVLGAELGLAALLYGGAAYGIARLAGLL